MRRAGAVLASLLVAAVAAAGEFSWEIVPTVGYRWGGDIKIEERAFYHRDFDVGISSAGAYGLKLDRALSNKLFLEFSYMRQETQFKDNQALFGEAPGGFIEPGSTKILDVTVQNFLLGLLLKVDERGDTWWYVSAGLGATHINALLPLPDTTRFLGALGVGLELEISPHLAARFEVRSYITDTDEDELAVYHFENPDCTDPCTYTYRYNSPLYQTEATFGLAIRF